MQKVGVWFFLSIILSPALTYAQGSLSKSVSVIVKDSDTNKEETITGAVVTLSTANGEYVASSVTGSTGLCTLNDILPGMYWCKVEYIGETRVLPILVEDDVLVQVNMPTNQSFVCITVTHKGFTKLDNDRYGGKTQLPNQLLQNLMP